MPRTKWWSALGVAGVALAASLIAPVSAPAASAPTPTSFNLPGNPARPYLLIQENPAHGPLVQFTTWFSWDWYVHITNIPAADNVQDIHLYTCVNLGPCSDYLSPTDVDHVPGEVAPQSQPHVTIHRGVTLAFNTTGSGSFETSGFYEHGPKTGFEFKFADGYTITAYYDYPTNVTDIAINHAGPPTQAFEVSADNG